MIDLGSREHTILILTPVGKDAELTALVLEQAGMKSLICGDIRELVDKMGDAHGAILIAEETLEPGAIEMLSETLRVQPAWSDTPMVLLTTRGESNERGFRIWGAFASAGNVTVLERPVRTSTLVSALQVALRSRRRQYQVRQLLEEQRAATRARDEFMSIASHELKTPITSLKLHAQVTQRYLERTAGDLPAEQAKRLVQQTDQQMNRLARLIDDMLDISRINIGKFSMHREKMDFAGLVKETIDRFSPMLSAAGCTVVASLEPCEGFWDRDRLEQVLNNLFTNAIRYAPKSAIQVSLKKSSEGILRFDFQDQGKGISREHLETIFQRFERASSSHESQGLGLGLFICRQIIEAHGGSIRADSEPGRGARFMIELPLGHVAKERGRPELVRQSAIRRSDPV